MSFLTNVRNWAFGEPDPKYRGTRTARSQATRKAASARYSGRAAAPVGSYRTDRVARGGGALVGARANVSARTVSTGYRNGRAHQPVQHAANQYSFWWGKR